MEACGFLEEVIHNRASLVLTNLVKYLKMESPLS